MSDGYIPTCQSDAATSLKTEEGGALNLRVVTDESGGEIALITRRSLGLLVLAALCGLSAIQAKDS